MRRNAFTLIELLVVIAIIAILAAILFPVFAQAKIAAKKTASISNQKQYNTAVHMYLTDNEDVCPIIQYNNTYDVRAGDQAIGTIVNPYMKNQDIWADPNSPIGRQERILKDMLDPTTWTEPTKTQQILFNLAIKNDYGYNTQYFSVMGANCPENGVTLPFKAFGTNHTAVGDPGNTLMFVNSLWDRSGNAVVGGGNWGLDAPCRQYKDPNTGVIKDTFPALQGGCTGRWWWGGWNPGTTGWNEFGGAWPYHAGKAVVGFSDSHAKVLSMSQVARGCDVKTGWGGYVFDRAQYIWDLDN
ncbi:MAG: prepilin-type N-terminal cleavage/methylation domain-containing protein [Armatimonadetes bacterium]|nr:prepilin-type N-terminal cleavage/methylation domain-containing protein [Armatimonadota bacterium]